MAEKKLSSFQQEKHEIVDQIKEKIQSTNGFIVIDYKGLTVEQDTEFRKAFREAGVEYKVLKNTLVRIALNELGYKDFDQDLNGPSAFAFAKEDALAPSKVAMEGIKKYNAMAVKCGMLDKKYVDAKTVEQLSTVPSKPALLSMLLSVLQAPVRGLAVALGRIAEKG